MYYRPRRERKTVVRAVSYVPAFLTRMFLMFSVVTVKILVFCTMTQQHYVTTGNSTASTHNMPEAPDAARTAYGNQLIITQSGIAKNPRHEYVFSNMNIIMNINEYGQNVYAKSDHNRLHIKKALGIFEK